MNTYLLLIGVTINLMSLGILDHSFSQSTIGNIPLPSKKYKRIEVKSGSFAEWLRNLPLKEKGADVLNYRGRIFKSGQDSTVAFVLNLDIEGRRLEQCMDVLVRLYADYLWEYKLTDNLKLPLPGGFWLKWEDWKNGFRPRFKGIDVKMMKSFPPDTSYRSYNSYLRTIYSESSTQQFYHAYKSMDRRNLQIGDIIIKRGTKGHAVIVVDLAKNEIGDMIVLIGNGDTPACQFFLLNHKRNKPWFSVDFNRERLDLPLKRKITWDGLRRFDIPKDD
jgi:hypothetical protein